MLRRLYNWTMDFAGHRNATRALAVVSFTESSFFPIPPDVLLVPMVLANRERAWYYATVCTIASVIGGIFGYLIGWLLYDSVGAWLINLYGYGTQVDAFRQAYAEWGTWIILIKGLTPIPYKIVTITSGFAGYDLFWFVVLSVITRAGRFFMVAALLYYYGEPVRGFIEKRLELVMAAIAVVFVGGFVIVRYVI
jgi:membrane protein YqaA with SNARE-associated domain